MVILTLKHSVSFQEDLAMPEHWRDIVREDNNELDGLMVSVKGTIIRSEMRIPNLYSIGIHILLEN